MNTGAKLVIIQLLCKNSNWKMTCGDGETVSIKNYFESYLTDFIQINKGFSLILKENPLFLCVR